MRTRKNIQQTVGNESMNARKQEKNRLVYGETSNFAFQKIGLKIL